MIVTDNRKQSVVLTMDDQNLACREFEYPHNHNPFAQGMPPTNGIPAEQPVIHRGGHGEGNRSR